MRTTRTPPPFYRKSLLCPQLGNAILQLLNTRSQVDSSALLDPTCFSICSGLNLLLGMTSVPPQVDSLSLHLVQKSPVTSASASVSRMRLVVLARRSPKCKLLCAYSRVAKVSAGS